MLKALDFTEAAVEEKQERDLQVVEIFWLLSSVSFCSYNPKKIIFMTLKISKPCFLLVPMQRKWFSWIFGGKKINHCFLISEIPGRCLFL